MKNLLFDLGSFVFFVICGYMCKRLGLDITRWETWILFICVEGAYWCGIGSEYFRENK